MSEQAEAEREAVDAKATEEQAEQKEEEAQPAAEEAQPDAAEEAEQEEEQSDIIDAQVAAARRLRQPCFWVLLRHGLLARRAWCGTSPG